MRKILFGIFCMMISMVTAHAGMVADQDIKNGSRPYFATFATNLEDSCITYFTGEMIKHGKTSEEFNVIKACRCFTTEMTKRIDVDHFNELRLNEEKSAYLKKHMPEVLKVCEEKIKETHIEAPKKTMAKPVVNKKTSTGLHKHSFIDIVLASLLIGLVFQAIAWIIRKL